MPNSSAGRKNIAVRLRSPAPAGRELMNSLLEVSSTLADNAPDISYEAAYTPEPELQEAGGIQEAGFEASGQHRHRELRHAPEPQHAPEFLFYTGTHCYYVRCRPEGPVWTPSFYFSSDLSAPEPETKLLYMKCRSEGPVWVPAVARPAKAHSLCPSRRKQLEIT